jgi:hypothetical protein
MGSHCSFGYLKHKLWPKEGSGVKLPIWLSIGKSQKLTKFTWVQRACNIPLESSQKKLQLCFKPHHDSRSACTVMGFQSCESPNWHDFRTPTRESWEKKNHLDVGSVASHRIYYKGEGGGFPQVQAVVSLECPCCPWLVLIRKVL